MLLVVSRLGSKTTSRRHWALYLCKYVTLADACTGGDPLVVGVDEAFEVRVGEALLGEEVADGGDGSARHRGWAARWTPRRASPPSIKTSRPW